MNLVIVVVDTLRHDYLGAYGNDWIRTPNMDRLAAESLVFDFSFAASFPTIPHRTDVLTGRYGGPFRPWRPLRHDALTFPELLKEAGYCTQLIHDTPHLVNGGHNFDWPFHAWTFVRGAEVDRPWIDDRTEWPPNWAPDPVFDFAESQPSGWPGFQSYARANRERREPEDWNCARLFLTASQWLKDNRSRDRFLLWLDCFDPHEPWDAPPEFMKMYDETPGYDGRIDPRSFVARNDADITPDARNRVAAAYAAKVSWVDRWLGDLLDTLDATGLAGRTALLLTSDHGTNVGDYGRFGKGAPVREPEGHTPLLLRVPDGPTGRCDAIVQPQDIFATVLGLAGVDTPGVLDSHDVVAAAEHTGGREVALCGRSADGWSQEEGSVLFTAFTRQWCLEVAARPEDSRLTPLGSRDEVSDHNADVVERLHADALDELKRRGTDPALMRWLRDGGRGDWPAECRFWDGYPGPAGFTPYFGRIYTE